MEYYREGIEQGLGPGLSLLLRVGWPGLAWLVWFAVSLGWGGSCCCIELHECFGCVDVLTSPFNIHIIVGLVH